MREWLVIESSAKNMVFASDEQRAQKGYIPRDEAEKLLGRSLGTGTVWFTKDESAAMRSHPEWRDTEPPPSGVGRNVHGGMDEMIECPFDGDCSCCQSAKVEIDRLRDKAAEDETIILALQAKCGDAEDEIDRLRAERDKWVEYVTCDRAQLVLDLEAALARAEKAEAQLYRKREEDRAVQEFLAQESDGLANNAEYKPRS